MPESEWRVLFFFFLKLNSLCFLELTLYVAQADLRPTVIPLFQLSQCCITQWRREELGRLKPKERLAFCGPVRLTGCACGCAPRWLFMVLFYPLQTALLNIVLRDSFAAPEKDIFLALLNWCKHNAKENHAEIMQAVRLPLMSLTELLNVVRPSGLLSPDAILDAIKVRSESRDMDLNYRGMLSKYLLPSSPRTFVGIIC